MIRSEPPAQLVLVSDLQSLLNELDSADSHVELGARTLRAIRPFGLTAIASGIITGSTAATPSRFHYALWPRELLQRYIDEEFQACDPGPRWARASGMPVTWSQLRERLPGQDPGHRVLQAAQEHGLVEGLAVPMRAADGAIGFVSMGGDRPLLEAAECRALLAIATAAFRTAERIDGSVDRVKTAPILTLREIEILPFLIHGHSDREIALLMNITEATVRFHLKNVRTKVGAVSRTHLAAKIVALGFVTL